MIRATAMAALVVAAAGCGGSGNGAPREPGEVPPPSRTAYIKTADGLCAEVVGPNSEVARSARALQRLSPSDPDFRPKAARHHRRILSVARSFRVDFMALEPPAADREQIDAFNEAYAQVIDDLRALIRALEDGGDYEQAGARYLESLAKVNELATAYGFQVCGRAPG
jgi:hypothetical protein